MSLVIFIPLLLLPALFILWATIDSALASVHVRVRVENLRRRLRYLGVGYSQDFPAVSPWRTAMPSPTFLTRTISYSYDVAGNLRSTVDSKLETEVFRLSTIRRTITPSDGLASGPSAQDSVTLAPEVAAQDTGDTPPVSYLDL